jgi:hypothetical protein
VQSTQTASAGPSFNADPIVATVFGIPAAVIVLAALNGSSLPLLGSGTGAVVGIWILGTVMCARGLAAMRGRSDLALMIAGGAVLGVLAMFLLLSDFFGWSLLLQPIAEVLGGSAEPASFDRATIVGLGVLMIVKWSIAWTSYLPRPRA